MTRPPVYNATRMPNAARMPHGALSALCVYVGRRTFAGRRQIHGHPLANPFRLTQKYEPVGKDRVREVTPDADRESCLAKYIQWLKGIPTLVTHIAALRSDMVNRATAARFTGFTPGLVCWCAPKACHGDSLADLIALTDAEVLAQIRPAAHVGEDLFRSVWLGELGHAQPLADWLIEQGDPRGETLSRQWMAWRCRAEKRYAKDRHEEAKVLAPFRDLLATTPGLTGTATATVITSDPKGDAAFRSLVARLIETDPHTWKGVVNSRRRPFAYPVCIWPGERDESDDTTHRRPRKRTTLDPMRLTELSR